MQQRVFIGIGSNLDNPILKVKSALSALAKHVAIELINHSSIYLSEPLGPKDQPDFINAVAQVMTTLSPKELLAELQKIEYELGRRRIKNRWGPREIDLDILLYGREKICTLELVIPHYGIKERKFVLFPLAEIAPALILPSGESIMDLLELRKKDNLRFSKLPMSEEI